jgi:ribosomal protein S18 acetylase RimI-like enzyme
MIAPKAQKMGVATKLLARVCEDAAREGFDFVEAYAFEEGKAPPYDFRGPVGLYERLGFIRLAERDGFVVMRTGLRDNPYAHCPVFDNKDFLLRMV